MIPYLDALRVRRLGKASVLSEVMYPLNIKQEHNLCSEQAGGSPIGQFGLERDSFDSLVAIQSYLKLVPPIRYIRARDILESFHVVRLNFHRHRQSRTDLSNSLKDESLY